MSPEDSITFSCPSCATRLTVPSQLAGVTGPCPYCQVLIQAPYPVATAPAQHPSPPQQNPYYSQNNSIQPPPPPTALAEANVLRPEPRQLPNRSEPIETPTRVRAEPSGEIRQRLGDPGPPPRRQHRTRIVRLIAPLLFIALALGVIYGVKTLLQMEPAKPEMISGKRASDPKNAGVRPILPEDNGNSFEDLVGEDTSGSLPVGEVSMPTIGGDQNPLNINEQAVDGGIAALAMLEDFLAMNSLKERLPHIETKLKATELVGSVLDGPLPEVLKITVDVSETNPIEKLVDYYYYVDFATESGDSNPQMMLVRARGTSPPKVVIDPFLDLFGGRFERFAAKPHKGSGTFQVIMSAGPFCYDDVPDAEKKSTLKILPREDAKEIAKAYFGKTSNIGYMLQDETSGIAYGQARPCTIFIRWNIEDDPQRPFLEALDIKALNWNP